MKIQKYILVDEVITFYDRANYIRNDKQLFNQLKYFNVDNMLKDFNSKKVDNYLSWNWGVTYYVLGIKNDIDIVLVFKSNEYDMVERVLRSYIRDSKLDSITNMTINKKKNKL
jgi:hypothetical protein